MKRSWTSHPALIICGNERKLISTMSGVKTRDNSVFFTMITRLFGLNGFMRYKKCLELNDFYQTIIKSCRLFFSTYEINILVVNIFFFLTNSLFFRSWKWLSVSKWRDFLTKKGAGTQQRPIERETIFRRYVYNFNSYFWPTIFTHFFQNNHLLRDKNIMKILIIR